MSKLYLIFGMGGVAVAGAGAGLGIYYGTHGNKTSTNQKTQVDSPSKLPQESPGPDESPEKPAASFGSPKVP